MLHIGQYNSWLLFAAYFYRVLVYYNQIRNLEDLVVMTLPEKELRKARKANRLINEKSPYLLQHAYNPVDWFPWGEEAFQKAARESKPVFLSIGYS